MRRCACSRLRSSRVPAIAATTAGYLIATQDADALRVSFVDPRQPSAARGVLAIPGMMDRFDLTVTESGGVVLVGRRNSPRHAFPHALDPEGRPMPFPPRPLHAVGPLGRLIIAPAGRRGVVALPATAQTPAQSLATAAEGYVGAWVYTRGLPCPAEVCEADVFTVGAGATSHTLPRLPHGGSVDLVLPNGARIAMRQPDTTYDDRVELGPRSIQASGLARPAAGSRLRGARARSRVLWADPQRMGRHHHVRPAHRSRRRAMAGSHPRRDGARRRLTAPITTRRREAQQPSYT
jgi:hypothetical protein